MITREEYIKGATGNESAEELHRRYYAQFVDEAMKQSVCIHIGRENILNSPDFYFSGIVLRRWDAAVTAISMPVEKMREAGDFPSLFSGVCVLKEAARQIREEAK